MPYFDQDMGILHVMFYQVFDTHDTVIHTWSVQVQKHVQIRMDAQQKYIESLLETACRIAAEQIAGSGAASRIQDSCNNAPKEVPMTNGTNLNAAAFHHMSLCSTMEVENHGEKHFNLVNMENSTFYEKLPDLKLNKPCWIFKEMACLLANCKFSRYSRGRTFAALFFHFPR